MIAHLVQSTAFAAAAWLLTLVLKHNSASTRHSLWLAASIKFLVPFSLLVSAGTRIPWPGGSRPAVRGMVAFTQEIAGPLDFTVVRTSSAPRPETRQPIRPFLIGLWLIGGSFVIARWYSRRRAIQAVIRQASSTPSGRAAEALRRIRRRIGMGAEVSLVSARSSLEPGVFGVLRPVLVMPAGIADRMTDPQLDAIVAHELCHVRRRDNLVSAMHMFVQAIFWFHPVVWWIGSRLVEERERACDEEVVQWGNAPEIYAESILAVCRFYLSHPLPWVAGVSGAGLRSRIEGIMTPGIARRLNFGKRLLLAAAAVMAIATPLTLGMLNAPPARGQESLQAVPNFEVASIRPSTTADLRAMAMHTLNGRLDITNQPLAMIIANAWNIPFQSVRLSGGPSWIRSARFDIQAIPVAGSIPRSLSPQARYARMMLALQKLLVDRFGLVLRHEKKVVPVYAVTASGRGLKLQSAKVESIGSDDCPDTPANKNVECHYFSGGMGRGLNGQAVSITDLAAYVENWTDRPVVDKTGIRDLFEIHTEGWAPMREFSARPISAAQGRPPENLSDPLRPTLFTVFEQLGLKLEAQKLPVDLYVIERVEKPSEN